jgi:hypothetical protein
MQTPAPGSSRSASGDHFGADAVAQIRRQMNALAN